jgi:hypothetical protein
VQAQCSHDIHRQANFLAAGARTRQARLLALNVYSTAAPCGHPQRLKSVFSWTRRETPIIQHLQMIFAFRIAVASTILYLVQIRNFTRQGGVHDGTTENDHRFPTPGLEEGRLYFYIKSPLAYQKDKQNLETSFHQIVDFKPKRIQFVMNFKCITFLYRPCEFKFGFGF